MRTNNTIVSMTDESGKTGNADFKLGYMPTDEDLVDVARRYGLYKNIKITITDCIGNKTRFTANVAKGKLVRVSDVTRSEDALKEVLRKALVAEMEKLDAFVGQDYNNPEFLAYMNVREEEVQQLVTERKQGIWKLLPNTYDKAMFNAALSTILAGRMSNESV